jgi:hypothetical protein
VRFSRTYLEDSLDSATGDEAAVDALLDGATHADGAEVVEVEMANVLAGTGVGWSLHYYT